MELDSKKIMCPVLASLYNAGKLKVDTNGRVELNELKRALEEDVGVNPNFAKFQAAVVAIYDKNDVNETTRLNRAIVTGERYLNIFKMHNNPNVRHGFGTAIRNIDGIEEYKYETYIASYATTDGKIVYNAKIHGE